MSFESFQFIIECLCAVMHSVRIDWRNCINFKETCCLFAYDDRIPLSGHLRRHAHTEPHRVVDGVILDNIKTCIEKFTRALILGRLACTALQEHFADSFPRNAHDSEARQHQDTRVKGSQQLLHSSISNTGFGKVCSGF